MGTSRSVLVKVELVILFFHESRDFSSRDLMHVIQGT